MHARTLQRLAGSVCLIAVLFLALSGCSNENAEREEGRKRLTQKAAEQIQAAEQQANAYDFAAANKLLYELREEVRGSSYADVATENKLTADIDAASAAVSDKQSDFDRKKRRGWRIVDGEFISAAELKRIVAEDQRKPEEQRQREEARRAANEKREAEIEPEPVEPEPEPEDKRDTARVIFGKGQIIASYQRKFALLKDRGYAATSLPEISYEENWIETKPIGKRIQIAGKVETIAFVQIDKHATLDMEHEDLEHIVLDAPGIFEIRVDVGDVSLYVPYEVIRLPIAEGMSVEEVIDIYGMPPKISGPGPFQRWDYPNVSILFDDSDKVWFASVF